MALKRGRKPTVVSKVDEVTKGAQRSPAVEANPNKKKQRLTPHAIDMPDSQRKTSTFTTITITGSKGQTYEIAVPISYTKLVPKKWEWTEERYEVAELIAQGIPIAQIPNYPNVNIKSRMSIYGWLEHPEFKEHIDGLILETGWANRRERLNNIQRVNELLLNKLVKEIDSIKLTDKSLGAVLSALQAGAKLIAQEKGEFIEESKITQDTNVTATVASVSASVDELLSRVSDDERTKMAEDFDKLGDELIRSITGEKG